MLVVDGRLDECLSHCLAQKWAKSSLLLSGNRFFLVWRKLVYVDDKDCFLKISYFCHFPGAVFTVISMRVNKVFF